MSLGSALDKPAFPESFAASEEKQPIGAHNGDIVACTNTIAAANFVHPEVFIRPVTDNNVLDQTRVFSELLHQTQPIEQPETDAAKELAEIIIEGTARTNGLTNKVALNQVTSPREINQLINGNHQKGKAAEIVTASDYRMLHEGSDPGIMNSPKKVASNVKDIRLAPDAGSKKDLLFAFERKDGTVIWKYNGQVKTGGAQYVADSLVEMAYTPGYGEVAYVDARYVNPDGSPKVGDGAFTEAQAKRLQQAKVRLRGIPNLEERSTTLLENIKKYEKDGLTPEARTQLETLRDDIAASYKLHGVAGRMVGGAAIGAASAAVLSLVIQLATEGKIEIKAVGQAAGIGATFGAVGVAADAGFYHLATKALGMSPEVAKSFAQQGVAIGFCLIAISTDLFSEAKSVHRGDITTAGLIGGVSAKIALDLLPLVMAPLGLAGLPILVGSQLGGRWLIAKVRTTDRTIERVIAEGMTLADVMDLRIQEFDRTVTSITAECNSTDQIFQRIMEGIESSRPILQLVKNDSPKIGFYGDTK
jgi:hypothetical protein